jgi:hypothetical protein
MHQNQLNKQACPYKGRARPSEIGGIIVVGIIILIALISLPQSFAKESGKDEQMKPKATVITPKDDQRAVEIKPVQASSPQVQPAPAVSATGQQIKRCVISSGGTTGASASYKLVGIVQQTAVSTGSSASYSLSSGFWKGLVAAYARGDANGDGVINSADVVYLINYLFAHGSAPQPWQAGDANCDGVINSADVVYLINYLFAHGSPPGC